MLWHHVLFLAWGHQMLTARKHRGWSVAGAKVSRLNTLNRMSLLVGLMLIPASGLFAQTPGDINPKSAPAWLAAAHAQALSVPFAGGLPQITPTTIPSLETDPDLGGSL